MSIETAIQSLAALVCRRRAPWMPTSGGAAADLGRDRLTGLPNRREFLRIADATLAEAVRRSQGAVILLVDIEGLRQVNESMGHAAGDAVLVVAAQRLRHAFAVDHVAARLGGGRFAVVLGPDAEPRQIAERIGRPIAYAGRGIRVGASVGIALAPEEGVKAAALIAAADGRLSLRKRGHRPLQDVAAA